MTKDFHAVIFHQDCVATLRTHPTNDAHHLLTILQAECVNEGLRIPANSLRLQGKKDLVGLRDLLLKVFPLAQEELQELATQLTVKTLTEWGFVDAAGRPIYQRFEPVERFYVKHYVDDERPSIKGNGFDGLALGETREEAEDFVAFLNERLPIPLVIG